MRIRANFLVLGLILCAGLAHGQAPDHSRNGYWWLKQTRSLKLGWVVGFVDGSEAVRTGVTGACPEQASSWVQTTAQDESAAKVCNNNQDLNRFKPPNATYGQVIDGLDHFYADYRNKTMTLAPATFYVYLELSGAPQSALDDYARNVRQPTVNVNQ